MTIFIATCRELEKYFPSQNEPLFTHDDMALVQRLRDRGHVVEAFLWDEDCLDEVQKDDCMIIRSTWNYMESADAIACFQDWLRILQSRKIRVYNTPSLMLWNLNKSYLKNFVSHVPMPQTSWVQTAPDPTVALQDFGAYVLKPQRGAAAKHAYRVRDVHEANALRTQLLQLPVEVREGGWLVQSFVEGVESYGEVSLVFFGGKYSHSVLKTPAIGDWRVQDELGGAVQSIDASDKAKKIAQEALKLLPEVPHYARVDLMRAQEDEYVLGEIEMIEPELFFLSRSTQGCVVNENAIDNFLRQIHF